jgi:hypothetical protein
MIYSALSERPYHLTSRKDVSRFNASGLSTIINELQEEVEYSEEASERTTAEHSGSVIGRHGNGFGNSVQADAGLLSSVQPDYIQADRMLPVYSAW